LVGLHQNLEEFVEF